MFIVERIYLLAPDDRYDERWEVGTASEAVLRFLDNVPYEDDEEELALRLQNGERLRWEDPDTRIEVEAKEV